MNVPDHEEVLQALQDSNPTAVADTLVRVAQAAGAIDVVIFLADFDQEVLTPLPVRGTHVHFPISEPVHSGSAGRSFNERRLISETRPEGVRIWVPVLEASDCTGVLALTLDAEPDKVDRSRCEKLGMLVGSAIAVAARYTDLYNLIRRRRAMSLPASMQWDLLPPLHLATPAVTSTGILEPAYEVGGDCFDHAVNGFDLDIAIMDAMGHGLSASMASALAMGTYRHLRREGQSLATIHRRLDTVIHDQYQGEMFMTGQICRLGLHSGELTWINAGHPSPLLLRAGHVIAELACRPSLPWGLESSLEQQTTELLQPGDTVLFFTDGVIEGRSEVGEPFGMDRPR